MTHGMPMSEMSIWQKAARGLAVISAPPTPAAFATVLANGAIVPSRTSLFQISEPADKAEAMVVTLVPPVSQAGSQPGFNGTQIQPQIGLYAVIKWGSQAQPATIEVDFAQGVAFPIWSNYISVDAINEQPYPLVTLSWGPDVVFPGGTYIQVGNNYWIAGQALRTGLTLPTAFSSATPPTTVMDGTGMWSLVTPPNVASYLSKGQFAVGTPRRTRQGYQANILDGTAPWVYVEPLGTPPPWIAGQVYGRGFLPLPLNYSFAPAVIAVPRTGGGVNYWVNASILSITAGAGATPPAGLAAAGLVAGNTYVEVGPGSGTWTYVAAWAPSTTYTKSGTTGSTGSAFAYANGNVYTVSATGGSAPAPSTGPSVMQTLISGNGVPANATPLSPGAATMPVLIPPFAQSLSTLLDTGAVVPYTLIFFSITGQAICDYFQGGGAGVTTNTTPVQIPSDAASLVLLNNGGVGELISSIRFVFNLAL